MVSSEEPTDSEAMLWINPDEIDEPPKDGVSPVVSVEAITGGNRVTITDVNGAKTFEVMDGKNGDTGSGGVG